MSSLEDRQAMDQRIASHHGRAIVTGMVEYASPTDLGPFHQLFGGGRGFQPAFDLYFHWYNLIHELGHIVRSEAGIGYVGTTPVMEEKLVNDFAVAYWRQYGSRSRFQHFRRIVSMALSRTTHTCRPDQLLDFYGPLPSFQKACQTALEYGFIQFALVRQSLHDIRHDFAVELRQQGFVLQPPRTIAPMPAAAEDEPMQVIVDQAISRLGSLGINLPEVRVFPHYNPNEHRAI